MSNPIVTREQMLQRVAFFNKLVPSTMPLIDAVLPAYQRENYNIIGMGVCEDASMEIPITDVENFHITLVKAAPGKGSGLHLHQTVEVFMPLSGTWTVIWGDEGESELTLGQWDTVSVPPHVMRGFRNDGDEEAYILAILSGTDPGKVEWARDVLDDARQAGFELDAQGHITGHATPDPQPSHSSDERTLP